MHFVSCMLTPRSALPSVEDLRPNDGILNSGHVNMRERPDGALRPERRDSKKRGSLDAR